MSVSAATSEGVEVWVVRHGERVDEVPGVRWDKCGKTNPTWFDPELTGRGHQHAAGVADALHGKFGHECPFDVIYTSPLVRTVQTAEKFSEVFPPSPLRVCSPGDFAHLGDPQPCMCDTGRTCEPCDDPPSRGRARKQGPEPGARSQRSGRVSLILVCVRLIRFSACLTAACARFLP